MNATFVPLVKRFETFLGGYGPFDTDSHTPEPVSTCNSDSNDKNELRRYGDISGGLLEKFDVKDAETKETFIDNAQTNSIVATIFIVMAAMLLAALIGVLFYWSYNKEPALFIAIISTMSFIYAIINIIYISVKRENMGALAFNFYLGAGIMMAIIDLIISVYFGMRSHSRMNQGLGGQDRFSTGLTNYQPE